MHLASNVFMVYGPVLCCAAPTAELRYVRKLYNRSAIPCYRHFLCNRNCNFGSNFSPRILNEMTSYFPCRFVILKGTWHHFFAVQKMNINYRNESPLEGRYQWPFQTLAMALYEKKKSGFSSKSRVMPRRLYFLMIFNIF